MRKNAPATLAEPPGFELKKGGLISRTMKNMFAPPFPVEKKLGNRAGAIAASGNPTSFLPG
jgi:hypothetical protein